MELFEGYYIVQNPTIVYSKYLEFANEHGWAKNIERLRNAIPFINPVSYRGIARNALNAFPTSDLDSIRENNHKYGSKPNGMMPSGISNSDLDENTAAKLKMYELLIEKHQDEEYDSSMLESLEQAKEVFNLIDEDKKKDYEIIRISHNSGLKHSLTLGYDVGTWGNDYSIVCDSSIMPQWHAPSWEDISELSKRLGDLNSNMLFSKISEAEEFRHFYLTRDRGERGDFFIIKVDSV